MASPVILQQLRSAERLAASISAVEQAAGAAVSYLDGLHERSVAPDRNAKDALASLDVSIPDQGSATETLELLAARGSAATTATAGGRFFGLVTGGSLPAAAGARVLNAAWDQIAFSDATSAVAVRCEEIAARWTLELLGLPDECSVGFVTGATMSNFVCLAGARHALLSRRGWDVQRQGLFDAPKLRIVTSDASHVTVGKALAMLGIGTDRIERVACDENGSMLADALPTLDANTIVIAQAGNVNTGACDPVAAICAKAKADAGGGNAAWVHVDGAFGLWAAASPSTQHLLSGYEAADSWVVDGHKWLNTPYDCGMAITRHPQAVHAAMATIAPYLEIGGSAFPKDMVPEFSRGARGVEVWAALHSLGRQGVADLIGGCCSHARRFAAGLREQGFDILNDVVLNQVVATWTGQEDRMTTHCDHVQESGEAWFGPTTFANRAAFRISVSSWVTDTADVDRTLAAIKAARKEILK